MKTYSRIGAIVLTFGWFIFLWVVAWGMHASIDVRIIVFCIGLFAVLLGAGSIYPVLFTSSMWMRDKAYQDKLVELDRQIILYRQAKEKLVIYVLSQPTREATPIGNAEDGDL